MRTFAVLMAAATILSTPVWGAELSDDERAKVHAHLEKMVKSTRTLAFEQSTWQIKGKKEERTQAKCYWKAPDRVRLDVSEGRGAGARALYRDGKVTGFKPGVFSFVKLTYDVRDDEVLSLRGQDMRETGFLDDIERLLASWAEIKAEVLDDRIVLPFKSLQGLSAELWLTRGSYEPMRIEVKEAEKVVEKYIYSKIEYNPALDDKLFEP